MYNIKKYCFQNKNQKYNQNFKVKKEKFFLTSDLKMYYLCSPL
jgi:hypothetical protein